MKVLNVLVNANYNHFFRLLVDYLIDCGHNVDVIDCGGREQWLNVSNYNLKIVQAGMLSSNSYDLLLELPDLNDFEDIKKVEFNLSLIDDKIFLEIGLRKHDGYTGLVSDEFNFNHENLLESKLSDIFENIKEAFIDAITLILQSDIQGLNYTPKARIPSNMLQELISLYEELYLLSSYYQETESVSSKFNFSSNLLYSEPFKQFNSNKYKFDQQKLELLTLYLLSLFNSRESALYTYNLDSTNKRISKNIILKPLEDNYLTITNSINNHVYNITKNEFYSSNYSDTQKSDTLVIYGNKVCSSDNYLLKIVYNPLSQDLWIDYHNKLYFFDQLADFIDYYDNKLSLWKEQGESLYNFLFTQNKSFYHQQLYVYNEIIREYPADKTIHQLFEEQVTKTPGNIAIVYEDVQLTYNELNEKSNQLAHYLRSTYDIQGDDLITLCLDRSEYMLIAILGVLKSGGAYVPIDPSYPEDRITFILNDTKARVLITDPRSYKSLVSTEAVTPMGVVIPNLISNLDILTINTNEFTKTLSKLSVSNLTLNINSSNLAYVIYTSGTTGKPKGVLQQHNNVHRLLTATDDWYHFNSKDVWTLFHSYVFDFTVWELWGSLCYGGKLVIPTVEQIKDTWLFYKLCNEQHVTILNQTPKAFYQFIDIGLENEKLKDLRYVIFGGEALNLSSLKLWFDTYGYNRPKLINMYGITETTVHVTYKEIREEDLSEISNIGRLIPDQKVYILDKNFNPLPVGSIGELYVGGAGLARGYLNLSELTNERFLPNPFQTEAELLSNKNTRIYKTGDLVRMLPDGDIEYIGRNDFQVKIRGFRIELGEIESQLTTYPGIKQSVVLALEDFDAHGNLTGNKYLVAYYVAEIKLDEEVVLNYLSQELPDYMVPVGIKQLERIPLTLNGKLNKKALPEIKIVSQSTYMAPRSEDERQLIQIWAETLNVEESKLGIFDDFFKLGGNSILAIKLIYKVNRKLNKNLEIKILYEARNVGLLAKHLNSDEFIYSEYQVLDSNNQNTYAPFLISNVQQAYYIGRSIGSYLGGVSTHVYYEVLYDNIDKLRLETAINSLINRHIILKSFFTEEFNQVIHQEAINYNLLERVCDSVEDVEFIRSEMVQEVVPLTQIPLFNIALSKLTYINKYIVHFSFDALLLDAESIRIFIGELEHLYKEPNTILPALAITFKDYHEQIEKLRKSELFTVDEHYWLNKLDDYSFEYTLPQRETPSNNFIPKFARVNKIIPKDIWLKLVDKSMGYGVSLTSVIILAYGKAMSQWSGQSKFCINLTLFSRLPLHEEVNNIIGDFTTLELFNYIDNNDKVINSIRRIHETLWNDIKHSLYDGIDFARAIRQTKGFPINKAIAPVVLTSLLGEEFHWAPQLESGTAINFMSAQTPQVWIDNKAYETEEGFVAEWDYVEQLFERSTIEAMHDDYCKLIEYLAEANWEAKSFPNLQLPIHDIRLIDEVNSFSQEIVSTTLFGYYADYIIKHELEDNIAVIDYAYAKRPESIYYKEGQYSYRQLLIDSELLAKYIIGNLSSSSSNIIAILSEKGYNQVVGTSAIMQAGFGYLPLNVGWPVGRLNEVLIQGMVSLVLLSRKQYAVTEIREQLSAKYRLIVIEDLLDNLMTDTNFASKIKKAALPEVKPEDIAYVIFTSGSTGVPKGVAISHQGALNTIIAVNERYQVRSKDKVLALSELSFDLSVYDIFGILAVGGTVVFPEQDKTKDSLHWMELVNKHQVSIWNTVPQLAELFIDNAMDNGLYVASLRLFLLSGDWIPTNLPNKIKEVAYKANVVSLGGATEGSIWSIWYEIGQVNSYWKSIPYGMAMPNQKMYVLNHNLAYCPVGVIGEICIGGLGVALNYYNNQKITDASFIDHPILGRIYKTGDLGVLSRLGYIEFCGRVDSQVKINGYRIELGEIDVQLKTYSGIKKSVVLALDHTDTNGNPSGNKYLVAYYVADIKLDEAAIIRHLDEELPDYMVPGILVHLEKLPLTINGKLDRSALPTPEFISSEAYTGPRDELDKTLTRIFAGVLNLDSDKLSISADFFRLGGTSILAIKLVNLLNKNIANAKLSITDIFKYKSIEKLSDYIINHTSDTANSREIKISKYNLLDSEEYKLSFAQERLWFIDNLEQGTNAYNIPMTLKLSANTNEEYLFKALDDIVKRHEILRSVIKQDSKSNAYQEILEFGAQRLINKHSYANVEELHRNLVTDCNHVFKLDSEYPIKFNFYQSKNGMDRVLSVVAHHIAFDGWSIDVFLREVNLVYKYYQELVINKHAENILPPLAIQYKDYALWQREHLNGEILSKQLNYWEKQLSGYERLNLMTDKPIPLAMDYFGANIYFKLDEKVSAKLRDLAKELRVSLYSVMLGSYYLLLSMYSNQTDIVIGTPVANRHYTGLDNLIGFFVNTLALRHEIDKEQTVFQYLIDIGNKVIEAQIHQDLPFEKLVDYLNVEKDGARHPIFQVMFGVQSFGVINPEANTKFSIEEQLFEPYIFEAYTAARFDITTMIDDSGIELIGSFNYRTSLYNHSTIENLVKTYKVILESIVKSDKQTKLRQVKLLNQEEYHKLVTIYNHTQKAYPQDKTIHGLFEEQVAKTPDNIAIVYEGTQLTYEELNYQANQLANYLRETYHIKGDDLIALYLDRSEHMLITILGVLKAGGAYVPMDPAYPKERVSFILNDTKARVLITDSKSNNCAIYGRSRISSLVEDSIILTIDDKEFIQVLGKYSKSNPELNISSNNLAYVIYTSGTTGNPKGVMIEHISALNTLFAIKDLYSVKKNCKISFFTSYVFDVSVAQMFTPLINGYELHIFSELLRLDANAISDYLVLNNINVCYLPPVLLSLLKKQDYPDLVNLIYAGEPCDYETGKYWSLHKNLYNYYGPTEASIYCLGKQVINGDVNLIGKPLNNVTVYILDKYLNLLPIGAVGELYIGGFGLARGYLNLSELTNERFLANPFQTEKEKLLHINARIYKTGDLVRMLVDGNIEYIGRNDFQVKIRGFRIELSEIEAQLRQYSGIKQVVVLASEHFAIDGSLTGNKYLIAYYVADANLKEENILDYLHQKLPDYMIPDFLVHLNQLPLTINGKLDRKALPNPEFIDITSEYIAPRDELDKLLVQIFAAVLDLDSSKVSMNADFFRLGGNSILAIKLVNQLNKHITDAKFTVADIFKYKNIEKLSNYTVHHTADTKYKEVKIGKYNLLNPEEYKLSFAQERLWFIDNLEQGTNAYNIPIVLKLSENINEEYLFTSLEDIVKRHEMLRSIIKQDSDSNAYQAVLEFGTQELINTHSYENLEELNINLIDKCHYIFKLNSEYPIKIDLYKSTNNKDKILVIVVHHIAFDGWSIDIFLQEINAGYKYCKELAINKYATLPLLLQPLTIQYKDYALWQSEYLSDEILATQLEYWRTQLSGYESLHLMTDKPRPLNLDYAGADIYFELDEDVSTKLKDLSKDLEISLYSVMLGGYYLLLSTYSNQNDIVIGTPVANRHYTGLEHLIGFFVNILALRCEIDKNQTVFEYLSIIGNKVIEAQMHQDLPFEKLVDNLNIEKDQSRHPIFQIMFGVQSFGENWKTNVEESIFETYALKAYTVAKFDITTMIDDSGAKLTGRFNYRVSLYNQATIDNLIRTYKIILKNIVKSNKYTKLSQINRIDIEEYKKLVITYNQTENSYPKTKVIHQLFEDQVAKTPNDIAVVYGDLPLTYKKLNEESNRLANYLRETYQIKGDDLVALCLDRSGYMLIAMLGVLKAGGAYVPMDPNYPEDRIIFILTDTKAKALIIDSKCHSRLFMSLSSTSMTNKYPLPDILTINDNEFIEALEEYPTSNPPINIKSSNLAYVIYTSGTTGRPKGVMTEHMGVVSLVTGINYMDIRNNDNIAQLADFAFDAVTFEVYIALLNGARLLIPKNGLDLFSDVKSFNDYLCKNSITVLWLTKTLFDQVYLLDKTLFSGLRYLLVGGEALNADLVKQLVSSSSKPQHFINGYGPTENTTFSCIYHVTPDTFNENNTIPIGMPISNRYAYILDGSLNLLPVGSIGELYLGGSGIARGYLNQPELTKERFLPNPFQTDLQKQAHINNIIYKTGDLVRMLPDGNIEYIGRDDFQVKMRGFRIELGEIESQLAAYPQIKQSVVLALEHADINGILTGNKYLVAYYVADSKLNEDDILNFLDQELPDYMMPSILVYVKNLPLTINGKLDRKSLPNPEFINIASEYISPRDELDKSLVKIFAFVLSLDTTKLSISADFFRLGGNSILAIKLVNQLNKSLPDAKLSIANIFKYKNIEKLANYIKNKYHDENSLIELMNSSTSSKLLFMLPPGGGGYENYFELANLLSNDYKCYGIDNYNIRNNEQIIDLYTLANIYLSSIDEIRLQNHIPSNVEYNLLGWSLGGQLALAIASILEAAGVSKINVVCLDTILNDGDEELIKIRSHLSLGNQEELYREFLDVNIGFKSSKYADEVYIKNALRAMASSGEIAKGLIKYKLTSTNIMLFKATKPDKKIIPKLSNHLLQLPNNNIENIIVSANQLKLVNLDCDHYSIMKLYHQIRYKIIGWFD